MWFASTGCKKARVVMGHSCGTCKHYFSKDSSKACAMWEKQVTLDYSEHPSDLHPCAHGEPVVANAICSYNFYELPRGDVHACHEHNGVVYHDAWKSIAQIFATQAAVFCDKCGLRTATSNQLALMYERHKEDNSNA
jgi:hypothetical protein